jgi:glycosyltransferase involved in cell wall biosynthesis
MGSLGSDPRRGRSLGSVLHLSENLTLPFDRRVWMELNALKAAGYEVSAICPMGVGGTEAYEVLDGIHIWRYPEPPLASGALSYIWEFLFCWLHTARLTLTVLARRGFDVIHTANPPDTFWAIALPFKLFGKKFVFDHHDLCPELYLSRFGEQKAGSLPHRLLQWLEKMQFATADIVISTNESYRQVALTRGHKRPDRVFVVRSGPSQKRFGVVREPSPELKRGKKFLVAYLGVMAPQDGVDHLVRAAKVLVKDLKRDDIAFTFIGAGDSYEDLRKLKTELGLDACCEFTGRVPDGDVERILATADVCVSPDPKNPLNDVSTMNKVLEYMACAKPVVAYDLREHRYSAGDGALYAEADVVEDLAAKIAQLLDDPALRASMGAYNRERFLTQMAWEHNAGILLTAYETLCGPPKTGA